MKAISKEYHDLIKDEKRAFLYVATIMPDGSPQVTPVWFNAEEEYILINTAKGRIKDRNMRKCPQVALCIQDPQDPYRYVQVRGRVLVSTEEGADEHINILALKYTGKPWQPIAGQVRVIYKILPESIDEHSD